MDEDTDNDYTEYAKNMRLTLSNNEITDNEGNLNHQYFNVKKGFYWTPEH